MKLNVVLVLASLVAGLASSAASADEQRVVYETEVNANLDTVWNAFTTSEGVRSWMAPVAEVELAVGGKMRTNYNPEGTLDDATSIENTILSFDPKRMLSLKATKFPEGFPFEEAARTTWAIFYFSELPSDRTKITVVGLGYTDDEPSQKMREFFAGANEYSLGMLKKAVEPAAE
ncbi:MAG: SRPBCC domain-containing protein [Acidobacteriota bacterium]